MKQAKKKLAALAGKNKGIPFENTIRTYLAGLG